jgi:hypothetical protein
MNTAGTQGGFVTANYVPGMGVVDPFGPPMTPVRTACIVHRRHDHHPCANAVACRTL